MRSLDESGRVHTVNIFQFKVQKGKRQVLVKVEGCRWALGSAILGCTPRDKIILPNNPPRPAACLA